MILYSERDNHYSHRVRIVLAEKDIACEIREFDIEEAPDDELPYPFPNPDLPKGKHHGSV